MVATILYAVLCGMYDGRYARIPNVVHAVFYANLVLEAWVQGQQEFWWILLSPPIICAVLFVFFCFHWMGAADIKMMSLLMASLGLTDGLWAILAGLTLAAVYGLMRRRDRKSVLTNLMLLGYHLRVFKLDAKDTTVKQEGLRLAVFLAVGTLAVVGIRGWEELWRS